MQKVFWQALTDLTIITAQYVYFYSQNLSAISCFTTEGCAQPTSKKDADPSKLLWDVENVYRRDKSF